MISHRVNDQICTIPLNSNMTRSTMKKIESLLEHHMEKQEVRAVLFDFAEVKHTDSTVMGMIVYLFRKFCSPSASIENESSPFVGFGLFSVDQENKENLEISSMDQFVEFFPDEISAQESMRKKILN